LLSLNEEAFGIAAGIATVFVGKGNKFLDAIMGAKVTAHGTLWWLAGQDAPLVVVDRLVVYNFQLREQDAPATLSREQDAPATLLGEP